MSFNLKRTASASITAFDNSTNGFASTTVQAAIEEAKQSILSGSLSYQQIAATSSTTTSSNTPVAINSMSLTVLLSGTYLITGTLAFSASSSGGDGTPVIGLYKNGTLITGTNASFFTGGNQGMMYSQGIITTLITSDVLTLRWNTTGGKTLTGNMRSIIIVRIA